MQACDPLRTDFRLLPLLQEFPRRQQCLEMRLLVELEVPADRGTWVSCLPLFSSSLTEDAGVVEVYSKQRLSYKAQDVIARLLQVYRNMSSLLLFLNVMRSQADSTASHLTILFINCSQRALRQLWMPPCRVNWV